MHTITPFPDVVVRTHRLICVDRNDKVCGLLSLSDIARRVKDNNILADLVRHLHMEKAQ